MERDKSKLEAAKDILERHSDSTMLEIVNFLLKVITFNA